MIHNLYYYRGVECVIEKHRAKHDVWNPVLSGCAVGGTLSARAGPAAACIGYYTYSTHLFTHFNS
jgi:import inner membrane translocase subunit TIM22